MRIRSVVAACSELRKIIDRLKREGSDLTDVSDDGAARRECLAIDRLSGKDAGLIDLHYDLKYVIKDSAGCAWGWRRTAICT